MQAKKVFSDKPELTRLLPLPSYDLGTVQGDSWDLYDGTLRLCDSEGRIAKEIGASEYRTFMMEDASQDSYSKRVLFKLGDKEVSYRVGPLARLNACGALPAPRAQAELQEYRSGFGHPNHQVVMGHFARLIETLACAEAAVELSQDPDLASTDVRAEPRHGPRSAVATSRLLEEF
jgi:coenzyme F420-reducing hydrogenase alpha subunit